MWSIPKASSMETRVVVSMGTVSVTPREPSKKVRRGWSGEVEEDAEREGVRRPPEDLLDAPAAPLVWIRLEQYQWSGVF